MDKNVLKKFAIESRQELMEKVANKINRYFVDEEFNVNQNGEVYVLVNDKHTLRLTKSEYENRQLLVKRIKEITLEQVIEEAAYTWFNRIIAIRYMEIHDYLPLTKDNQSLGVRVLSSKDNTTDPEIMKIANLINPDLDIEFNKEYYGSIQDNNKRFEYILLLICKKLGKVIPQVFDGITDYIDILIPDNLLNDSGYITKLLSDISEDNFNSVEIIGWLYQYYNQLAKDKVISAKKVYKKNEIVYATQLFTTDWIVKYMVENSLGKYWLEHSDNDEIAESWKYLINENIDKKKMVNPKDITFIDPCCGSGHILVYAFELFYQIYLKVGYNKSDIPELILENNLYGLDIDDRAGQLSILSILLKARDYDKNIFNKKIVRKLNIMSIQESNTISKSIIENITDEKQKEQVNYLIDKFENAKEIGSLLSLDNSDYGNLKETIIKDKTIFGIELREKLIPIIKIANILSKKYNIVVTNPPYMNSNVMPSNLKNYILKNYETAKSDLFSAFIIKNMNMISDDGKTGFMTPYVWMFISSYEELRKYILNNINIDSLIQFEYSAFEEATVPICSFILSKGKNTQGIYFRLSEYTGGMSIQEKMFMTFNNKKQYFVEEKNKFTLIPGNVIGYWISNDFVKIFNNKSISDYLDVKQGTSTGDNDLFLKLWFEVQFNDIEFNQNSNQKFDKKWYPATKGGDYRKWYGNNEYIVDWQFGGKRIKECKGSAIRNPQMNFEEGLTWTGISSKALGIRYCPKGFIYLISGKGITGNEQLIKYTLAFCCSKVAYEILKITSPTLSFEVGYIASLPLNVSEGYINIIDKITTSNIELAKDDWNSFETSWDFTQHPLIEYKSGDGYDKDINNWNYRIKDAFESWKSNCEEKFNLLKQNEEMLNRLFINIYCLQDELTSTVDEKDITIRKADREREIKSLISYAVGCMFGRYSLDKEGLVYAGGRFESVFEKYKGQNLIDENGQPLPGNNGGWAGVSLAEYKYINDGEKEIELSYSPDIDNIIPLTEDNYFGDDIVSRFKKFIEVVYGKETLYENLEFIAETLGKKNGENSEETIRRYFINDFYKDHVKMYQKRPIYWLFDSGKKNGFKCLIYMHRYNEGLVSKIRLDYLHRMQNTYEKELKEISDKLSDDVDLTSKRELSKRQADISAKLQETNEYDEKIAHIADQKINIDLDDGVVVNYAKFSVKNPKTGKEESILANSKDIVKKKKEE